MSTRISRDQFVSALKSGVDLNNSALTGRLAKAGLSAAELKKLDKNGDGRLQGKELDALLAKIDGLDKDRGAGVVDQGPASAILHALLPPKLLAGARAPAASLSGLERQGYWLYPVAKLQVLNSDPKAAGHDAPLAKHAVGKGGPDAIVNGTFTYDSPGRYHMNPAGAVMRNGKLDTPGVDKAKHRGGVAVLEDGRVLVGRMHGNSTADIQKTFCAGGVAVHDFMGGGALLIENGAAVSSKDLLQSQRFDQGKGGLSAQQMRATRHTLVGIKGGQAYVIVSPNRSGAALQRELLAAGFTAVVKFDGGSGAFVRDTRKHSLSGTDAVGLAIWTR